MRKKAYNDKFVEVTCTEITAFAKQRRLKHCDLDALRQYIRAKWPEYTIYVDDDGLEVVQVPDMSADSYRKRLGVETSTKIANDSVHSDVSIAEGQFACEVADLADRPVLMNPSESIQRRMSDDQGDFELPSDFSLADDLGSVSNLSVGCASDAALFELESKVEKGSGSDLDSTTLVARSRYSASSAASVSDAGASRIKSSPPSVAWKPEDDVTSNVEGAGGTPKRSAGRRIVDDAIEYLDGNSESFSFKNQMHFGPKKQAQSDAILAKIRKHGRKAGGQSVEGSDMVAERCFNVADQLEVTFELVQKMRTDFLSVVSVAEARVPCVSSEWHQG